MLSHFYYAHRISYPSDGSYIHDTTGDFGPYYYWKLRQQVEPLFSLASLADIFVFIFSGEGARKKQPGTRGQQEEGCQCEKTC